MSTRKAKRISDEEWQVHKQVIERLWLEEKRQLVGRESVMESMEKDNFFAT